MSDTTMESRSRVLSHLFLLGLAERTAARNLWEAAALAVASGIVGVEDLCDSWYFDGLSDDEIRSRMADHEASRAASSADAESRSVMFR